ncbi:coenzyme A transferase [Diplocarpon mali]|nr:coenzyme A transferase [Diplocarpon mali]
MATKRISSACLASSIRVSILRIPSCHVTRRYLISQLHTTAARYEQQKANTSAKGDLAPQILRRGSNLYKNADEAVADLKSGSTSLKTIIAALVRRGREGLGGLTAVSNNAGSGSGGGLSPLVESGQIEWLALSFLGANKTLEEKYLGGEIAIELCPQGTIAERIRAGGAGIPAFFTSTGVTAIIGALEVSAAGDLANFMIPGRVFKGMGGAMDVVGNPVQTKIVVATDHVARDGSPKVVETCELPLTGARVVSTIITDLVSLVLVCCVFEVDRQKSGLTLTELAPRVGAEEVRSKTGAEFKLAEDVRLME